MNAFELAAGDDVACTPEGSRHSLLHSQPHLVAFMSSMTMLRVCLWLLSACQSTSTALCADSCPDQVSLLAKPVDKASLIKVEEGTSAPPAFEWDSVMLSMFHIHGRSASVPENAWTEKAQAAYPYGGNMLTATLWLMTIYQVGGPKRDAALEALDKTLEGYRNAFHEVRNPGGRILSAAAAGALLLIKYGDGEQLAQGLVEDTYKTISAPYEKEINIARINKALEPDQDIVIRAMNELFKLPSRTGWLHSELRVVDNMLSDAWAAFFGSFAGCIDDKLKPVSPSPEQCTNFERSGVFILQLQFVMTRVALQAARGVREDMKASEWLQSVRKILQLYLPHLRQSFNTYKSWRPSCEYHYTGCFGLQSEVPADKSHLDYDSSHNLRCYGLYGSGIFGVDHHEFFCWGRNPSPVQDENMCGPARFIGGGFYPFTKEEMANRLGCQLEVPLNEGRTPANLCESGRENACSSAMIEGWVNSFRETMEATFDPIFELLELMSEEIPLASTRLEGLLSSGQTGTQ